MDTYVKIAPAGEGSTAMASSSASSSTKKPKRFEIKKWNAVALWAWGVLTMPSISTASVDGSKPVKCAH